MDIVTVYRKGCLGDMIWKIIQIIKRSLLQSIENGVWELAYERNLRMDFVLFIQKGVWELGYENDLKDGFCCYF